MLPQVGMTCILPRRALRATSLVAVVAACSCSWGTSSRDPQPLVHPVSEVHQPPRLLGCSAYRPPAGDEAYTNAVQVEFVVTATGSVTNAKVVEEGAVTSSSGHLGEALVMARSCTFTPARHWGLPVAVRMTMWFIW
jgi:outer membrane biosynthesis protein TonB